MRCLRENKQIDEVSAKIIRDLLVDARKSFTQIANECKLSTASIGERFVELQKKGIIVGSTTQVNFEFLGFTAVWDFMIRVVNQNEVEQVLQYVRKIPFKIIFLGQFPRNEIVFLVGLTSSNEIYLLKEILRKNRNIMDIKLEQWTGCRNIHENLELLNSPQKVKSNSEDTIPNSIKVTDIKLDEVDFQIIEKLSLDSMQPFRKISEEIGVSPKTVSKRYRILKESGIIKTTIQIDPTKLGYYAIADFMVTLAAQTDLKSVINEFLDIKDTIVMVTTTSGEYDLSVHIAIKDINQLLSTQIQVSKIRGLSKIWSSVLPIFCPLPMVSEYITTF
jgi:DNA-binding Lrp family transcriptional regulator